MNTNWDGVVFCTKFRRIIALLLVAFILLLSAHRIEATNLVSRPAGFLRFELEPNSRILASAPFQSLGSNKTSLIHWDAVQQMYVTNAADMSIPGEGYWIANADSTSRVFFLSGEINLQPSNTLILYPALNLAGYPFAGNMPIQETALWTMGEANGRHILDSQSAEVLTNTGTTGQGFWYLQSGNEPSVWTEVRPYDDLFGSRSSLPRIESMEVENAGETVLLRIDADPGSVLEIYYQDVVSSNRFESGSGWKIAVENLAVDAQGELEWRDSGDANRVRARDVPGRYYLTARADVDLDADGIPDAREFFVLGNHFPVVPILGAGLAPETEAPESGATNAESLADTESNSTNQTRVGDVRWVGRIIYVDQRIGNDQFSGKSLSVAGQDGPKKTIGGALDTADAGDKVIIQEGLYKEDLKISGRAVSVRIEGNVRIDGPVLNECNAVILPPQPTVVTNY